VVKIRWKRAVRVRQVRNYQDSLLHNTSLYIGTFANDDAKMVDFIDRNSLPEFRFTAGTLYIYMIHNRSSMLKTK